MSNKKEIIITLTEESTDIRFEENGEIIKAKSIKRHDYDEEATERYGCPYNIYLQILL